MKQTMTKEPRSKLDSRFSSADAKARRWSEATTVLESAELYWLTTVRRDGRPHVTPLIGLWIDDAFLFCTGDDEQKAKNIEANPHCAVITGCNKWNEGFDIISEGEAVKVKDNATLHRLADAYVSKYGEAWRFEIGNGVLINQEGGAALVFAVNPVKALGFGKGEPFSQTIWRFA